LKTGWGGHLSKANWGSRKYDSRKGWIKKSAGGGEPHWVHRLSKRGRVGKKPVPHRGQWDLELQKKQRARFTEEVESKNQTSGGASRKCSCKGG